MMTSQPKDQRPRLVTVVPGPRSVALRAREDRHLAPGTQHYAIASGVVVDHASGSVVTDVDGNTLLDLIGGIGVGALGHSHPAYVAALIAQLQRAAVGSLTSEARVELNERLAAWAPSPGVDRVQLYSSGAEAVESALRLAKARTGKHEIVGFWGGFHGKTLGAMSIMGSAGRRGFGPLSSGNHSIPYADCFRCPIGSSYPECGLGCVELGRAHLRRASCGDVAAFVVEPMQGSAGNVIPPDDFLVAVRALADELDALLIVDEMITGFGRTGKRWGLDHSAVRPDIVTLGKAFGGGFPLSGVMTTGAIAAAEPWSAPSSSSSSYGGNPLAAAAGAASLRILDEEGLVVRARDVGASVLAMLQPLAEEFPFIGEVRGRGLFLAIELVRESGSREPASATFARRIFDACLARGLLTMAYAPRVRLQPALTIDVGTASHAVDILREVFSVARDERWSTA